VQCYVRSRPVVQNEDGLYFNLHDRRSWRFRYSKIFLVNVSRFWNPVHLAEVFHLSSLALKLSTERRKGQEGCPSVLESIQFNSISINIPFKKATQNSELILSYNSHLQKNYRCVLKYVCISASV
jgi:hypothetical protein